MFRIACFLLLTGTCIAGAQPSEDAVKKELKLFQGKWMATYAQGPDGKVLSDEELKSTSLVVEGDKYTFKTGDATVEGTFKVDPTKKIKTMDVFSKDSPEKSLVLGIYEIKGDTRRSCFAEPEKGRPTAFTREKGFLILEWKQAK